MPNKKYREGFLPVFSPALNEWVVFTSDGFNHLRFTIDRKAREYSEQLYKLRLLSFVVPVIKKAKTIKDYRMMKNLSNSTEYWSLVGVVGNSKIKVILRRVGKEGKLHFWSVMRLKK